MGVRSPAPVLSALLRSTPALQIDSLDTLNGCKYVFSFSLTLISHTADAVVLIIFTCCCHDDRQLEIIILSS